MSQATVAKTAKSRATIAIRMLLHNKSLGRPFDDCFEMGDGDAVVRDIRRRAKSNSLLTDVINKRGFGKWLEPGYIDDMDATTTPGPWTVDEFDGRIYIVVADDPMCYVTEMINPKDDPEGSYPSPGERIANAHLIAAAPDLLEACKEAVLILRTSGLSFIRLEQAIAKAQA